MRFAGMFLALVATSAVVAEQTEVTPVQKVLQLLQGMHAKGTSEMEEEQKRFSTFSQWCDDTRGAKQRSISRANTNIEALGADIGKANADISDLSTVKENLESDVAAWTHNLQAATGVRQKERADFQLLHQDYSESIDALERAVGVLKSQNFDRKQANSMLQTVSLMGRVPESARRVISAFLQSADQDVSFLASPEANGYEFQSGGVIDMLEKLRHKFVDELRTAEKEEMNTKHAFNMVAQDLTDHVGAANDEIEEKSTEIARREEDLARAKGDLTDTTTERDADSHYLSDLTAECQLKSQDFESRQRLRSEELSALSKAMEIINSADVAGHAEKHLPQLLQKSIRFIQLGRKLTNPRRAKVAALLSSRAKQLHSAVLSMMAVKVTEDPFKEVKKMVQDLIVRLMEEANSEASHKGWCDSELAKNKGTREEKTSAVDKLTAQVTELSASADQLKRELAELGDAIAALDRNVAEASEMRATEKAKNTQTVKEAIEAQDAVAQALQVLKEFYAHASSATAFFQVRKQTPSADAPETFDSAYTGMQSSSTGVVGMLEVIQSDFARLETETKSTESQSQSEYDEFVQDSRTDKATKQKTTEHKEHELQQTNADLTDTQSDLESNQGQLDTALSYYEKLRPSCVDSGLSYEERVQARKEEIQSLKEALDILEG